MITQPLKDKTLDDLINQIENLEKIKDEVHTIKLICLKLLEKVEPQEEPEE